MPEELWTEIPNIVQEAVIKAIPKKKKCRKAKWLSEEALQTAEKRRKKKRSKNYCCEENEGGGGEEFSRLKVLRDITKCKAKSMWYLFIV